LATGSSVKARTFLKRQSHHDGRTQIGDQVFGVPICIFRGEQFWGNDRIPMLERRLEQAGLSLSRVKQSA
jgi:2-hydroxychromene-2-carboxylate isomerase